VTKVSLNAIVAVAAAVVVVLKSCKKVRLDPGLLSVRPNDGLIVVLVVDVGHVVVERLLKAAGTDAMILKIFSPKKSVTSLSNDS
jgi:hypothetical protein